MTLRITRLEDGSLLRVTLRLEGSLVGEWAALLELECSDLLEEDAVILDLTDVGFVDRAGTEVLQRLSRAGVQVLCSSGPLASVLAGAGVAVRLNAEEEDTWP